MSENQMESGKMYTAKLLFPQSPTRHTDYTVTTTVTMQSLFSSPADTVTTEQWLHRTHTLLGIHYHGAYVEICLQRTPGRQLHGHYMGRH